MLSLSRQAVRAFGSTTLFLFSAVLAHASVVTVSSTVTNIGSGTYQYAYSIANTNVATYDSFLIDIAVPASPGAVTNVLTPSGFTSQFDSVLGLVSFLENTSNFGATPTAGFSFDSTDAPGASTFTASLSDSSFNITTVSGAVTAPLAPAPEPASFFLIALFAPAFLFLKWRKAGRKASSLETNNHREMIHVSIS